MRLIDDRYSQQRFRLEVALRMIRHEARTATIRDSTGISEDRIRKLHRSYVADGSTRVHRRRGKSPRQTHCLTHNLQTRVDATLLTSILQSTGIFDEAGPQSDTRFDVDVAARICDAYELFACLRPKDERSDFTFEHAWYLVRALNRGIELIKIRCARCAGFALQDVYSPRTQLCALCETKQLAERKQRRNRRAQLSKPTNRLNHGFVIAKPFHSAPRQPQKSECRRG